MLELTAEQKELLVQVGHYHLMLESHQTAVRFCRDQLKKLRQRLTDSEQASLPQPQVS